MKADLLKALATHLSTQPWDTNEKGNFRKTERNTKLAVKALNQALLEGKEIFLSIALCAACETEDPIPGRNGN